MVNLTLKLLIKRPPLPKGITMNVGCGTKNLEGSIQISSPTFKRILRVIFSLEGNSENFKGCSQDMRAVNRILKAVLIIQGASF